MKLMKFFSSYSKKSILQLDEHSLRRRGGGGSCSLVFFPNLALHHFINFIIRLEPAPLLGLR